MRAYRGVRDALPLRGTFGLRPVADTWRWSALSALVAIGAPEVVLLAVGRLDLAFYTCAGGLCAVYGHGLPYAARARALAWVVFGMVAGSGVALATAALTGSAFVRVAVIALLAGVFKVVCDASRIGPPGNIILTFVTATGAFLPTRLADLPWHLTLVLLGGVLAWSVCLAPALFRPHGPERRAVARALESTARLLRLSSEAPPRARYEAAAAIHSAWHTLSLVRSSRTTELAALAHLVTRAETLAARAEQQGVSEEPSAASAEQRAQLDQTVRLDGWARELRSGRAVPRVEIAADEAAEIRGLGVERAVDRGESGFRRVMRAFEPSSPYFPIGVRLTAGSAAAGWASMALGVDRPYWAVVTAAAVYVANTALSWQRAVQRVLGNLGGVLLFTALAPMLRSAAVLIAVALACQLVVEATVSRNYGLATLFVTPMALMMSEFAQRHPTRELVLDRWLDTCVGAVVGMLVCFAVPNRRVSGRVDAALRGLDDAIARTPRDRTVARERLATALIEVRESADTAAGEWWSAPLPQERIVDAERAGHRLLAELSARPVVAR